MEELKEKLELIPDWPFLMCTERRLSDKERLLECFVLLEDLVQRSKGGRL